MRVSLALQKEPKQASCARKTLSANPKKYGRANWLLELYFVSFKVNQGD